MAMSEVLVSMPAIETYYAGVLFRSRLEARWAVFFDQLRVKWFYEYEGYKLPSGTKYVPDFWLHELGLLVEIKPLSFRLLDSEAAEAKKLCEMIDHGAPLLVLCGSPGEQDGDDWGTNESGYFNYDYHYLWCLCPKCWKAGVQFDGRGGRVCGDKCSTSDKDYTFDDPRIVAAKKTAMSYRFY